MPPVGSYQLDVRLPGGNARSGASPVLGSTSVRVEEFQPDTLALAASFTPAAPKGWIRTGQDAPTVEAQARLDNLYGEPASNHRVQAVLRTEKSRLHLRALTITRFMSLPDLRVRPNRWTCPRPSPTAARYSRLRPAAGPLAGRNRAGPCRLKALNPQAAEP